MAKGTAIILKFGATLGACIEAVATKYAEKRVSTNGWHGTAVVNVEKGENDDEKAETYIVKGIKNGWEIYRLAGRVIDEVVVKTGEFEEIE
jgi:hypothetical protein